MKPIAIWALIAIFIACIMETHYSNLPAYAKALNNLLSISYEQQEGEKIKEFNKLTNIQLAENNISSVAAANNNLQGILIVTKKVINEGGGNSRPSDFIIKIHGNNASPSSFQGNSSGTVVKLDMGMYSVTESGPSGYNATSSMDCSGAVMSVETKQCYITNSYIKSGIAR
jgi:Prealbumin-like fold domain